MLNNVFVIVSNAFSAIDGNGNLSFVSNSIGLIFVNCNCKKFNILTQRAGFVIDDDSNIVNIKNTPEFTVIFKSECDVFGNPKNFNNYRGYDDRRRGNSRGRRRGRSRGRSRGRGYASDHTVIVQVGRSNSDYDFNQRGRSKGRSRGRLRYRNRRNKGRY